MIKLNLGSHNKNIGDDWINVDGLDLPNVDLICDLTETPFNFTIKKPEKIYPNKFNHIVDKYNDLEYVKSIGGSLKFEYNTVDEISMTEVLEHISFRNTEKVLREIQRILKPGGKFHIQVPDCGKMMEMYVNKQICDCVNHKEIKDGFNANKDCIECNGKALINTKRWLYSFTGAQKHRFDTHLMVFTRDILRDILFKIGFQNIRFEEHIYKLKVTVFK